MQNTKKVGIIGAGFVGESFGKALIKAGYQVMFSSREPQGDKAQKVRAETGAPVGLPAEVIAFADVIAIALPADAVLPMVQEQQGQWVNKVIIDMNNRFVPSPSGQNLAQELAALTGASVVKAFNTIGAEHYLNPNFNGQAATMFIAGDVPAAKDTVRQIAADLGFDPIDAGGLDAATHLENMAKFWVHLVRSGMGRNVAIKLLRQ